MHEFQVQKVFTTQPILHHQRIINPNLSHSCRSCVNPMIFPLQPYRWIQQDKSKHYYVISLILGCIQSDVVLRMISLSSTASRLLKSNSFNLSWLSISIYNHIPSGFDGTQLSQSKASSSCLLEKRCPRVNGKIHRQKSQNLASTAFSYLTSLLCCSRYVVLCTIVKSALEPSRQKFCFIPDVFTNCSDLLPHRQIKYPVNFDDELKIGDVRYDDMT